MTGTKGNGKESGIEKVETSIERKERLRKYYKQCPDLSVMKIRKRNFVEED
jgi:hypothetical protein